VYTDSASGEVVGSGPPPWPPEPTRSPCVSRSEPYREVIEVADEVLPDRHCVATESQAALDPVEFSLCQLVLGAFGADLSEEEVDPVSRG
jgi:hypothetical protein